MRRLLLVSVLVAGSVVSPIPVVEPVSVVFVNPQPVPSYTARSSRTRPRQSLTLNRLPTQWRALAWCESRHRLHANNNNTYYGLWQIHKGWFKPFDINPETATIEQQWQVAQHVYKRQGAAAWTCSKYTNFK